MGLATMPVVVATSLDDGEFYLRGLVAGRYRLRVEGSDIFTSEVRFFEVPADGVRLIVARRVTVSGEVVDPAGGPVSEVRVGLASDTHGHVFAVTDEHGRFSFTGLQEGVFQAWAAKDTRAAPAVRVHRLGSGPFEDVQLVLGPAFIVAGRVVDTDSERGLPALVKLTAVDSAQPSRHAVSQPDGNFRIPGVLAGRYAIEAVAPGYVSTQAMTFRVGDGFSPVIELSRGAVIEGHVVTDRGSAIAGAVVTARGVDTRQQLQVVSERSRMERLQRARGHVPGPDVRADSSAGLHGARFVPRGELGILFGPIPNPPPRGAAALRIARALDDATGGAANGALDDATGAELAVHPDVQATFVTDASGRFRITGLRAGDYRVIATHADYADTTSPHIYLRTGKRRTGLTLVMKPGITLVGTVTNSRGELVVGATLIAEPAFISRRRRRPDRKAGDLDDLRPDPRESLVGDVLRLQAVTGVDGRYSLGPFSANAHVRVTAVRHGDVERAIRVGKLGDNRVERTEDFVLPVADAILRGRVRDSVNFPVRGAHITVERLSARKRKTAGNARPRATGLRMDKWVDSWRRSGITDDTGAFRIADLAPGSYRLVVEHDDFPRLVTRGETGSELDIELAFGGGISGEIRDAHTGAAIVGARVLAAGPGGATVNSAAQDDGGIDLVPLTAGTWTVSASAPGYVDASYTFDVTAGAEPRAITVRDARIELERGAVIAGTVRDHNGGRVHGATVEVSSAGSTGTAATPATTTDEQGGFRMRDVPTGAVVIRAHTSTAHGRLELSLRPGDEYVTLDVRLDPPGPGADSTDDRESDEVRQDGNDNDDEADDEADDGVDDEGDSDEPSM